VNVKVIWISPCGVIDPTNCMQMYWSLVESLTTCSPQKYPFA
jgi:hypothetical protein